MKGKIMESNHKYVSFECVHGDTDRSGNSYMTIDGYPANTGEQGTIIATVYYTPHEDFVVHFNPLDYPYEELPAVLELVEAAKEDLIAIRKEQKNMTLEQKINAICTEDEYAVFKADEHIKPTLETDMAGQTYLNIEIDTSIEVRAAIAEEVLPSYVIEGILNESECDHLAEAIEIGGADLSISFGYYKDMFTDELTIEESKKANDPTLCDRVLIFCEDFDNMQTEIYQPHNQKWFRDFIDEELAGMDLPSARELISQMLANEKQKLSRAGGQNSRAGEGR